MRSLLFRFYAIATVATLSAFALPSMPGSASAAETWTSGHPPKVISVEVDSQRRLVAKFSAADGMKYGGFLLIDNNVVNATPASRSATYGPIMYCNNKSSCMGLWIIPADNGPGPYSFTTEPLSVQRFPAGTYYLQVDTKNGDPFASTRQEEFSEIIVVELKAGQSSSNQKVPLLSSLKLPLSNGTPICTAWRDHLSLGNRVVQAANTYNRRMNTALEKIPTRTPAMELIYQRALRQTSEIKKALAEDLIRAKSACSDTPSVVAENGEFVPVPIPSSNGTPACNASRKRLVYVNQELTKIVNNIKTTKRTQTTRINQLETRFKQLSTDLNKSWAELFQTCNPF